MNPQIVCLGGKPLRNTKKGGRRAQGLLFRACLAENEEPWGWYGAHPGGPGALWGSQRLACMLPRGQTLGGGISTRSPCSQC